MVACLGEDCASGTTIAVTIRLKLSQTRLDSTRLKPTELNRTEPNQTGSKALLESCKNQEEVKLRSANVPRLNFSNNGDNSTSNKHQAVSRREELETIPTLILCSRHLKVFNRQQTELEQRLIYPIQSNLISEGECLGLFWGRFHLRQQSDISPSIAPFALPENASCECPALSGEDFSRQPWTDKVAIAADFVSSPLMSELTN